MSPFTAVAIDVGGTKTAIASVSLPDLRVEHRTDMATPSGPESGQAFLDTVSSIARDTAKDVSASAVGISICELVGTDGRINSAHRINWAGLAVSGAFVGDFAFAIESDVRAAAIAEARFGAGRHFDEILYVNIGSGVSSCWVKDGRAHRGARGNALVIASSHIDLKCPHCGVEISYVPEDIAGGLGVSARYQDLTGLKTTAREIFAAAEAGDAPARQVVDDAVRALGINIGLGVNILDPDAVVIGGGVGTAGGRFAAELETSIRNHIWSDNTRPLPIRTAELGGDSALIGAAITAADAAQGMSSPKLR